MKKQLVMILATFILLLLLLLSLLLMIVEPSLTGNVIFQNEQKIKIGYCPTMESNALEIFDGNNYELIRFSSASEVLSVLNNNQIDMGLIGRKAKEGELSSDVKETILESGYTLVSNNKEFINYSQLSGLEIYTYLPKEKVEILIPENKNTVYYESKQEAINKILEGEVVLILWEDWQDDFELLVVMDNNEKVKDFRGVFLYEI